MKRLLFLLPIWCFSCGISSNQTVDQETEEQVWTNPHLPNEERVSLLIAEMTIEEKASQMVNAASELSRFNIPEYEWWNEALHGLARSARATVFPQPIGLGATFDPDLLQRIGSAVADEGRAVYNLSQKVGNRRRYKGLTFWSPNVNIFRDARWGRGHETYGEDPFLAGQLGAAYVRGLQGDHPKYLKAAACAKHFGVHSGPETMRFNFDAVVSPKDLYETYLPAFQSLVDANVESVMCAYNQVNGEPCCGSSYFLNDLLRKEMGFKGHVVTDCGALFNIHHKQNYTGNDLETIQLAIRSGVNLNCGEIYAQIPEAVAQGYITEAEVDQCLSRLLLTRFKLGMFDPEELNPYNRIDSTVIHSAAHQALALEAAQKSIVLLKNKNGILPLQKSIPYVFVTGPMAANIDVLIGNYYGISDNMVTVLEGIASKTSAASSIRYQHGVLFNRFNTTPLGRGVHRAKVADVTIAVMGISGMMEGEDGETIASETNGDRVSIELPPSQMDYLRKMRKSCGDKPLVVVFTGGSPLNIAEVEEFADAIVYAWYPGEQGGQAVADILFGEVNPTGKLPMTFPMSEAQIPDFTDYSLEGRTYKYMKEKPLYTFGYGLTYGELKYSEISIVENTPQQFTASITLTNPTDKTVDDVIQLYTAVPRAEIASPQSSLQGVERVSIGAGEQQRLQFEISADMMSYVDHGGKKNRTDQLVEVYIGNCSPSQRSKELGGMFRKSVIDLSPKSI